MTDSNGNGKVDRVLLAYGEKVKHALDTDGKYPLTVAGYKVTRVGAASGKTLTLMLKEKTSADPNAKPSVKYTRSSADPVRTSRATRLRDRRTPTPSRSSPSSCRRPGTMQIRAPRRRRS